MLSAGVQVVVASILGGDAWLPLDGYKWPPAPPFSPLPPLPPPWSPSPSRPIAAAPNPLPHPLRPPRPTTRFPPPPPSAPVTDSPSVPAFGEGQPSTTSIISSPFTSLLIEPTLLLLALGLWFASRRHCASKLSPSQGVSEGSNLRWRLPWHRLRKGQLLPSAAPPDAEPPPKRPAKGSCKGGTTRKVGAKKAGTTAKRGKHKAQLPVPVPVTMDDELQPTEVDGDSGRERTHCRGCGTIQAVQVLRTKLEKPNDHAQGHRCYSTLSAIAEPD